MQPVCRNLRISLPIFPEKIEGLFAYAYFYPLIWIMQTAGVSLAVFLCAKKAFRRKSNATKNIAVIRLEFLFS